MVVFKNILLLLTVTTLLFQTKTGYAQTEDTSRFNFKYNVNYEIDAQTNTKVREKIEIINKDDSTIPSEFVITFENNLVEQIKAEDFDGNPLQFEVKRDGKKTIISLRFKDPAIGSKKATEFAIEYKIYGVAQKVGRNFNVHTPKPPQGNNILEYNLTMSLPSKVGNKIYISPQPLSQSSEGENIIIKYDKPALKGFGINASFGNYQIMNFKLSYDIRNTSILNRRYQVALPPYLENYQDIYIESIEPKPTKIYEDMSGNKMAVFNVGGRKNVKVTVKGKAKTNNRIISGDTKITPPKDRQNLGRFLNTHQYWTVNKEISTQALEFKKSGGSNTEVASRIYHFVVNNLSYDYKSAEQGGLVERKGAIRALESKNGLCMEYADLFIAMSRAAGIPARQIDGYAYAYETTTPISIDLLGGDFLHSWAQYYDPDYGWVSVDPTWGSTSGLDYFSKLDTNHLALAIKGVNSKEPLPAGAYKHEGSEKQVEIDFASENTEESKIDWNNFEKIPLQKTGFNFSSLFAFLTALVLCMIFLVKKSHSRVR